MKTHSLRHNQRGQTVVTLLVFVLVAIMLTTSAAFITTINTRSNTSVLRGHQALVNAETGVYTAMQAILRDSTFTSDTVTMPEGTVTISVTGTTTRTIVSQGVSGSFHRTVTVVAGLTGTAWTITSWVETP